MRLSKRGQFTLSQAPDLILVLVIVGAVGAVGLAVLAALSTSFTGSAAAAIANITLAIGNFFSLMPTTGIVFGAVVVLGAVVMLGYSMYNKYS